MSRVTRLLTAGQIAKTAGLDYWTFRAYVQRGYVKPDFQSSGGKALFHMERVEEIKSLAGAPTNPLYDCPFLLSLQDMARAAGVNARLIFKAVARGDLSADFTYIGKPTEDGILFLPDKVDEVKSLLDWSRWTPNKTNERLANRHRREGEVTLSGLASKVGVHPMSLLPLIRKQVLIPTRSVPGSRGRNLHFFGSEAIEQAVNHFQDKNNAQLTFS